MGIFDNILSNLFSRKDNSVKPDENYTGDYTVESISADLKITSGELDGIMRRSGVIPVKNMLTQEQVDKIYDNYYRSFNAAIENENVNVNINENKRVYPAHRQIPVKILPSKIISDYSRTQNIFSFKNKWISFSGSVNSVERDGQNFIVNLISDDRNFYGVIICKFVNNAESKVLALRRGQDIKLTGFIYDIQLVYQNDIIVMINCNIIDQLNYERINAAPRKVSVYPITNITDSQIRRSIIPGLNDKVYSENGKIYTLTNLISSGGEGSVYSIDIPGRVAKIYNERSCTVWRREKLKLMTAARLNYNGICFPMEILNNSNGEFTGFIMEEAKGRPLTCLKMPQKDFMNEFPAWKKDNLVCLSISILKKIKYLHDHDVLMGDISLNNIMFVSPSEVYFIDTDSYQYKSYPCYVGTDEFVAPELFGLDLANVMRTEGNENFAVATLLFMLMMQGKQPYAHQGGSQSAKDIKAMIFPYGSGERPVPGNVWKLQPIGSWRYIWSHLTNKLKNAFIDTFRKDGSNNTEETRFSVNDWLVLMYAYHTAMSYMISNDAMSAELFPTREKYSKDIKYKTCRICGETLPEDLFYDETTCKDCHFDNKNK